MTVQTNTDDWVIHVPCATHQPLVMPPSHYQHITIATRYQEDFRTAVVHVHIGFEDFIVEGWSKEAPVPSPLGSIGYQQTIAW